MYSLEAADLEAVNRVVEYLVRHPDELHRDEFCDLRAYMTSLGANIPPPRTKEGASDHGVTEERSTYVEEEEEEAAEFASLPDVERWELEEVPDDGIPDYTGADPTPEDEETAITLKAQAAECAAEGNLSEAVDVMAQALRLVPGKAMYWSQRASYLLQCARPGAALRDSNRALSINPENVRALRVRGTVNRHLGKWEEALKDLVEAQTVDYDEQIDELLKLVQTKAGALRQRRRQAEEAAQERQREALRRQREKERERQKQQQEYQQPPGGFPSGGFPSGGFPSGGFPPGMEALFEDPELREAMQDPEVASKMSTMMQNPAAALQLLSDPKLGPLMRKLMSKVMGGGGGGMPSFSTPPPPETEAPKTTPPKDTHVVDELD